MTDRITEIQARCEAATPGPWGTHEYPVLTAAEGNPIFIAHAREDIPWLLAQLAATQELLAAAISGQETLQLAFKESQRRERAAVADLKAARNVICCRCGGIPKRLRNCNDCRWRGPQAEKGAAK